MLRSTQIPKFALGKKCLLQQSSFRCTSTAKLSNHSQHQNKSPDFDELNLSEEEEARRNTELPKNPLYTPRIAQLLVAARDHRTRRIFQFSSKDINFNPWAKFIQVWANLIMVRRALLVKENYLPSQVDAKSFPNLHNYFMGHKRFLAAKIVKSKLPPEHRAFALNWSIAMYTGFRDQRMLEFLYQKYPDCFPKRYIEKIVTSFSTHSVSSNTAREFLLGEIPTWIERLGSLKSLEWNRDRSISLMAYSARTNDVKLFTEILNDFMQHETDPGPAWKGIREILASETSEQVLKDLYEAAISAKMVTSDLTWGIILGLNRYKNTKAILDFVQKVSKSDPKVIAPQAFDVAVQALLSDGDIENAYAVFVLRPDDTEENFHGYKKTRTALLLALAQQGYFKRMLEIYEKSFETAVPSDSFGIQTLLTHFIETNNEEWIDYFWNQFKERNLMVSPVLYSLMTRHYLNKGEPDKVKLVAEQLRESSEEGSRSRMLFGTARLTFLLEQGELDEALGLYHKMTNPDSAVFSKVIPALFKAGRLDEAKIELDRLKARVKQEENDQASILKAAANMGLLARAQEIRSSNIAEIFPQPAAQHRDEMDQEED